MFSLFCLSVAVCESPTVLLAVTGNIVLYTSLNSTFVGSSLSFGHSRVSMALSTFSRRV
jgi:hypothetical protein